MRPKYGRRFRFGVIPYYLLSGFNLQGDTVNNLNKLRRTARFGMFMFPFLLIIKLMMQRSTPVSPSVTNPFFIVLAVHVIIDMLHDLAPTDHVPNKNPPFSMSLVAWGTVSMLLADTGGWVQYISMTGLGILLQSTALFLALSKLLWPKLPPDAT